MPAVEPHPRVKCDNRLVRANQPSSSQDGNASATTPVPGYRQASPHQNAVA